MTQTSRQPVITGLGTVVGPDIGAKALTATLSGTRPKTSLVNEHEPFHKPDEPQRAILARNLDLNDFLPSTIARRMSPSSRFSVAAAQMSIIDANLNTKTGDLSTGIVMSSVFGPVTSTERLLDVALRQGPQLVSPFAFAESVANVSAGQIAISTNARGPNLTVVQREAGSLIAVGRGAKLISSGRVERVLTGSVDEIPPILHKLLAQFDALAKPDDQGEEIGRPFDANRNGFIASEGATVLVIEEYEAAKSRGIRPLIRIRAFGSAFDPTAPRIGWGTGHKELARAVKKSFQSTNCKPTDVTRIVSGASGALKGDLLEAKVLKDIWNGLPMPPIIVPKAYVGQYGGGFLAAAVKSTLGGFFGATPGFVHEDKQLGIRPFKGGLLEPSDLSFWVTIGSGGSAAWLLVESC